MWLNGYRIFIYVGLLEMRNGYLDGQRSFRCRCMAKRIVREFQRCLNGNWDRLRSFRGC